MSTTTVKICGFMMNPQPTLDVITAQGLTAEEVVVDDSGLRVRVTEDLDVAQQAALSAAVSAAIFGVTFTKP